MTPTQDTSLTFVLLALAMPALSCLLCLLVPKRFMWLSAMVSTLLMFVSVIAAAILYAKGWNIELVHDIPWFVIGTKMTTVTLLIDQLSLTMLSMVVVVSFLVHLYSVGFMADDKHSSRYFAFLGFFTFSMLGLIISGNLLVTFCFWELVGFSSYLLIGHYRERSAAGAAATKAFIMNRIGDAMFIVGLMIIWTYSGSFNLFEIADNEWMTIAGICFFGGVIGKSAQFPLLTWLPDAMEGPTPVSALIHAATMVAAGIFLILRLPFIVTPVTAIVMAVVGAITALYGGWMALHQYDLKKILAYSTISQLGLMVMAIGAGSEQGAFVHLITHAFFKACLFLAAGAIIHTLYHVAHQNDFNPQDIRNMGGFYKETPGIFIATTVALAAICGIPFFSGFFSKEMIIVPMVHRAIERNDWLMWCYVGVFFISSMLTVLYSYRLYVNVFFGKSANPHADLAPVPRVMQWPVTLLAILCLSVFFWQFKDKTWHVLYPKEHVITIISILWTLASLGIGYWLFTVKRVKAKDQPSLDYFYDSVILTSSHRLSSSLVFIDQKIIDNGLHAFVYSQVAIAKIAGYFDKYIVDGLVWLTAWVARTSSNIVRSAAGGQIQSYLAWSAVALIIFIFWLLK